MADTKDPYAVLGVPKTASAAELKKAFRDLAKKYHPDRNRDDKTLEAKFKQINSAYEILGDETKRARYDRGEIDANGQERGFGGAGGPGSGGFAGSESTFRDFGFDFGAGGRRSSSSSGGGGFGFNPEDIFSELFGGGRNRQSGHAGGGQGGARSRARASGAGAEQALKGEDIRYELSVTLQEAVRGGKRRIQLATGKTIDVTIPPGTQTGDTLRLKGQGVPSHSRGPTGDALVTLTVEPHAYFTQRGLDLMLDVPISLSEAVMGAEIKVPTLDGQVSVKVPKNANSGTQLRLKGKGATNRTGASGDQYLTLKIMLPEKENEELSKFVEKWGAKNSYNPRKF